MFITRGHQNHKYRLRISIWSIFCGLVFTGILLIHSALTAPWDDYPEHLSQQVSAYELDDHLSLTHTQLHTQVGKYRKRFKHTSDTGISFQLFGRQLARKYIFPFSAPAYQKPHFSSIVHTFLYRFACF